ncbi:MAG: hypothetical protein ACYCUV_09585, partial [Phycisphaerae bacterium]
MDLRGWLVVPLSHGVPLRAGHRVPYAIRLWLLATAGTAVATLGVPGLTSGNVSPANSGNITLSSSSALNFDFAPQYDNNGDLSGYSYDGAANFGVNMSVPIVLDATFDPGSGSPPNTAWNSTTDWGSVDGVLDFTTTEITVQAVVNDVAAVDDPLAIPSAISSSLTAINALQNLGPTERSISVGIADFTASGSYNGFATDATVGLSATADLEFDVTIPQVPATVLMNQSDVVLNGLTIDTGGSLSSDGNYLTINNVSNGQLLIQSGGTFSVPGATTAINVPTTIDGLLLADGGAVEFGAAAGNVANNATLESSNSGYITFNSSTTTANNNVIEA